MGASVLTCVFLCAFLCAFCRPLPNRFIDEEKGWAVRDTWLPYTLFDELLLLCNCAAEHDGMSPMDVVESAGRDLEEVLVGHFMLMQEREHHKRNFCETVVAHHTPLPATTVHRRCATAGI
jgi:hypothetical protein